MWFNLFAIVDINLDCFEIGNVPIVLRDPCMCLLYKTRNLGISVTHAVKQLPCVISRILYNNNRTWTGTPNIIHDFIWIIAW